MRRVSVLLGAALLAVWPVKAWASFHQMKIAEVYPGSAAAPNAQYVVLQMYGANQGSVANHGITVFSANGTPVGTFKFSAALGSGGVAASQTKILIGTTEAAVFFGVATDLTMTAALPRAGGKVCFDAIPEDCVAWGNWAGGMGGVGMAASPLDGLILGKALTRRLDVSGSPTVLEIGDDRDQSSNDFTLEAPAPQNFAGVSGVIPPSTCGNSALESLEPCDDGNNGVQTDDCLDGCVKATCGDTHIHTGVEECDDGNRTPGDGCSPSCTTEVMADAGVGPDAAPKPDAAVFDAAPGPDGPIAFPDGGTPASDPNGCDCKVARQSRDNPHGARIVVLLALAAVGLARRRRATRAVR